MTTLARKPGQGSKWLRKSTRWAIYHRDGFACVYCRATIEEAVVTVDHVVAQKSNDPSNLVTACLSCNSKKRALSLRAFLAFLRARNVDTTGIAARVRRLTLKKLDRVEGARLAALSQAA